LAASTVIILICFKLCWRIKYDDDDDDGGGSPVFTGLTNVTDRQTHRQTDRLVRLTECRIVKQL